MPPRPQGASAARSLSARESQLLSRGWAAPGAWRAPTRRANGPAPGDEARLGIGWWSVVVGSWLVVGGWWELVGGWWELVGGWWLVGVGWWLVGVGWWLVVGGSHPPKPLIAAGQLSPHTPLVFPARGHKGCGTHPRARDCGGRPCWWQRRTRRWLHVGTAPTRL